MVMFLKLYLFVHYYILYIIVPHSKKEATVNGCPSGPMTELQVITSQELLHLGKSKDSAKTSHEPDVEEKVPMLKEDCVEENHVDQGSDKYSKDIRNEEAGNNDGDAVNDDKNTNNSTNIQDQNEETSFDREKSNSLNNIEKIQEPKIEIGIESSTLLNEVGKLLEVKRVSFDDSQKTTL